MTSAAIALKIGSSLLLSAAGGAVGNVASLGTDQLSLKIVFCFSKAVDELKRSSTQIGNLIHDAALEPKDGELLAMADWMKRLMTVAYAAEDVVDEVQYEFVRIDREGTILYKDIRRIFVRLQMACKIDNINRSLQNLYNEAPAVGLFMRRRSNGDAAARQGMQGRETISLLEKHESASRDAQIVGREKFVKDITETLNDPNNQETMLLVMAVVGLPGVGKTTLARLLTEQLMKKGEMTKPFDITLWVYVSPTFDVTSILRRMLKLCEETTTNPETLEELIPSLRKKLEGKRFFLVLDDVWNEDADLWKDLKSYLRQLNSAKGSTVIVTTRSSRVAEIMRTLPNNCDLEILSDDQSWSIIKDRAFDDPNHSIDPDQEQIGREIAGKCAGLPLAAKILGSLMHSKNSSNEWRSILQSLTWQNSIMSALMLSFDNLKSPLKPCFAYCSMLDRGSLIKRDQLIQLWMAQGFLNPCPHQRMQKREMEMEDIGNEYFDTLLEKSLFQDARKDEDDIITECKMHDLVHEFAIKVSRCESWTQDFSHEMDDSEIRHDARIPTPEESMPNFNHEMGDSEIRHVARISTPKLESMSETSIARLRSLFSIHVSNIIFPKLRALRVLSFYEAETQELPNSLDKLKHLRYLDLSHTAIRTLPEFIGKLYNLQTLRLPYLEKCPKEIQNLINLRHLYVDEREKFEAGVYVTKRMKFEAGILGRLTDLRTLRYFNVGPAIEELGGLNQLRGHLIIDGLEHVRDGEEAKNARLVQKSHLHELTFKWTDGGAANENQTDVLDGLEPHGELQRLNIVNFMGAGFPSWIMRLQNLKEIRLVGCNNCEGVPTLGHLPKLRSLEISEMHKLKRVGAEFYGTGTTLFPELKILDISDCKELIEWMEAPAEGEVVVFPCLEELNISVCKKLSHLPDGLDKLPLLERLRIGGCPSLKSIRITRGIASLRELNIQSCEGLSSLEVGLQYCTSLQQLVIEDCDNLTSIPITEGITSLQRLEIVGCQRLLGLPSGLQFCTSLQYLEIIRCSSLVSYHVCDHQDSTNQREEVFTGLVQYLSTQEDCRSPESIPAHLRQSLICNCGKLKYEPTGLFHSLTRLKKLTIGRFWRELDAFPDFQLPPPHDSQLEELHLWGWPKLKSLPQQIQHYTCLKTLGIYDFGGIEALPEWLGNLTSLESLTLWFGENLKSLPQQIQHLTCLKSLWIRDFNGIEALPEWLGNLTSLESLHISECEHLKSLPTQDAMKSLTKLKELSISCCPLLAKGCTEETGPEWPKISHIPGLDIEFELTGEMNMYAANLPSSTRNAENLTSSRRNAVLDCLPCCIL